MPNTNHPIVPEPRAAMPALRLEDHPFFKDLDSDSATILMNAAVVETFSSDQVVFKEGSPADGMFLVLQGRVAFLKTISGTELRTVSFSEVGDSFGEIGVLTGSPRSLGAVASGPTTLARIPREALSNFISRTAGPAGKFLQSIVHHLQQTTGKYVEDMMRQEKMALVGNMVGSIIHDFKNPFTLIDLAAQLMMQQHRDERTRHLCSNITKQVQRMVEMGNEVSEFSRGVQSFKPAKVDMRGLVQRFRELNEPYFQKDHVRVEIEVDALVIEAEENKLLRVLQNLVVNAMDACHERNDGQVRVRILDCGEHCEIIVSDNGHGIPEQIRNNVFEPFVTFGKTGGTGLGTAIVKSVVEAHKGRIRFETATAQGTTFFISLPKTQPQLA